MARRDFRTKKLVAPPYKDITMKDFILGGLLGIFIVAVVLGTNYLRTGYVIWLKKSLLRPKCAK